MGQDRRYDSIESRDLTYHVTVHEPDHLEHVVCYADGADNHESLEPHTRLPFITFEPDRVYGRRDLAKGR